MQTQSASPGARPLVRRLALGFSVVLTLLLTEGAFRAWYAVRDEAAPHWDRSTASEWTWAKRHLEAGRATLPSSAHYDPHVGWLTAPDQDAEGVRTNSAGIRSAREFSRARLDGRPRILFVGDSYTFGAGVANEETFQEVLSREFLPDWDVLNLGVSGHGADQTLLVYEGIGREYDPDVVVFGLFERGFRRILVRFRSYLKPWFSLDDAGALRLNGSPVLPPEDLYALYASGERQIGGLAYSYAAAAIAGAYIRNFSGRDLTRESSSWQLMAAILQRFHAAAERDGAKPLLLIFPDRPASARRERFYRTIETLAREEARDLGLPVLSLRAEFREMEKVHRPKDVGGHLSREGHRRVAELLATRLEELGWLGKGSETKPSDAPPSSGPH